MERYKMLESIAIAMIEAGSDYEPIKKAIKSTMKTKKVHSSYSVLNIRFDKKTENDYLL